MTSQRASIDLATSSALLDTQWRVLRTWLRDTLDDDDVLAAPSVLPQFTVGELLAHVRRAMDALAACEPAVPGLLPVTLGEYLGGYAEAPRHDAPADSTSAVETPASGPVGAGEPAAPGAGPDPLRTLERSTDAAFATLGRLGSDDRVIQTHRAPLLLSDLVLTRLLELVVHADDLERSVRRAGESPVERESLELVAQALLGIVVARGGWSLELVDPLLWMRLATGRVPYHVDRLAEALRARFTSDSVPDLGRMLPLV
ncbi:maleylpyruvate isomerase N-terminal domain-containing protein [Cellulomonas fimi]|uniref:Mycothiol-dependent maleylpyruvate isomerase metal-binding domain-containing protein n=1 Tax=Cellulomonas fimi TaxID=1708 RepID=A0A7Y0LYD7_CELFI|nr:maleylpyruvate isomerase N-terminal domain-containing protein [Cellulomonas fimi]NMR20365.1 hypothetical protein [Cellulomonas fimi]